jgi:anti-anti-sigma factor
VQSGERCCRGREDHVAELDRDSAALLGMDVSVSHEQAVITLSGELDLSNVDILQTRLQPVLKMRPSVVVFDLGHLRFLDSSGIGLLLEVANQVGTVRLRQPSEIVRQIVKYTGLSEVLPIDP